MESSQIEDRTPVDRQSESQPEEKVDTSAPAEAPRPPKETTPSSDEDERGPTRKVVIDEDEPIPQKEPQPKAAEPQKSLPYEDHNYGFGRPVRQVQQPVDENNEPFPVIGGLASYIGDEENHAAAPPPAPAVTRVVTR